MELSTEQFNLKFGVEIEFCILVEKRSTYDFELQEEIREMGTTNIERAAQRLDEVIRHSKRREYAAKFRKEGVQTHIGGLEQMGLFPDPDEWVIKGEPELQYSLPCKKSQQDERDFYDELVARVGRDGFIVVDFEVNTPVLNFHDPDSFRQLAKVLDIIRSFENVYFTDKCGLHVHISSFQSANSQTRSFDFNTLRNFLHLITLGQRPLSQFHPLKRLQKDTCRLPVFLFDEKPSLSQEDMINIIDSFAEVDDIIEWASIRPSARGMPYSRLALQRTLAFNFTNLLNGRRKQTIEARQHEGTLDTDVIVRWVKTVGALICKCHDEGNGTWFRSLGDRVQANPQYGALELLADLGLTDLVSLWKEDIYDWGDAEIEKAVESSNFSED